MRLGAVAVILGLAACGSAPGGGSPGSAGGAGEPSQPAPQTLDTFADRGRFLDWPLGAPFQPGDRVKPTDEPGSYVLGHPVVVDGRRFDEVLLRVESGALVSVTLRTSVTDEASARQLQGWVDRACKPFTDRVERHMPSALGTADEDAEPVQLSEGSCEGATGGVHLAIYENQSFDSEYHHADVTVVLTPGMP